jgi:DNA-directed RNA polymerase subunit RPC12/RpoP
MTYICGDCGSNVSLGKDALVACPHCAGRVLYKERTKRYGSLRVWLLKGHVADKSQNGSVRSSIDERGLSNTEWRDDIL